MNCDYCGRDLNAINQDNMSYVSGEIVCEDCFNLEGLVNEDA